MMTDVAGTPELSGPELEDHCPGNSFEFLGPARTTSSRSDYIPSTCALTYRDCSGSEIGLTASARIGTVAVSPMRH